MSCESREENMEGNHLEIEDIQLGEKKQKLRDYNLASISLEQWLIYQEQLATLNHKVDTLSANAQLPPQNDLKKIREILHIECAAHPLDPKGISFTLPLNSWIQFIADFKELQTEVKTLSLRCQKLESLVQDRSAPCPPTSTPSSAAPVGPSVDAASLLSTPVSRNSNALVPANGHPLVSLPPQQELTTHSLPKEERTLADAPIPPKTYVITHPQQPHQENVWMTMASKREKKKHSAASLPSSSAKEKVPTKKTPLPALTASSSSLRDPPPTPPQAQQVPIQSVGGATSLPSPPPKSRFRQKISEMTSREKILTSLLLPEHQQRQPRSADAGPGSEVSRIYISCPLTKQARLDPIFSLRKLFQAWTHVTPLGISLVSKTVAEIFLYEDQVAQALDCLPPEMVLWDRELSYHDVKRRAASYNRGYFPRLRWASLAGLSNQLQLEVLETAEASVPRLPLGRQKSIREAILKDREWVLSQ